MSAKDRNKGLGASDAGPACGLSKFKSPVELYLEKRGEMPPAYTDEERFDEALQLEMGRVLEPVAIRRLEKKTGLKVSNQQLRCVDPFWSQRWATLDGDASDGGIVEAKSVGIADPREWGDEYTVNAVPIVYLAQIHHAFGCVNDAVRHCWVPVIVLNRQFRVYRVERDDDFVARIREQEQEFWSHVMSGTPPKPQSDRDLKLLYPEHKSGKREKATALDEAKWHALGVARAEMAKYEASRKGLELALKTRMGDAEELVNAKGETLLTWKKARDGWKFDTDSFGADEPKLFHEYMKPNPGSRRLLYKGE